AILYRLLAGGGPFESETPLQTCLRATTEEPPSPRRVNSAVPRDLETIVRKAMAKDPGERFAAVDELVEQLRRFLADEPLTIHPPSPWEKLGKWAYRHRQGVLAWGASAGVLLAATAGALAVQNRQLRRTEEAFRSLSDGTSRGAEELLQGLPVGSDLTHHFY